MQRCRKYLSLPRMVSPTLPPTASAAVGARSLLWITRKLQFTVPKAVTDQYGTRLGDELQWIAAGEAIHVIPAEKNNLKLFSGKKVDRQDRARVPKHQVLVYRCTGEEPVSECNRPLVSCSTSRKVFTLSMLGTLLNPSFLNGPFSPRQIRVFCNGFCGTSLAIWCRWSATI
jgi:hypothetical protein